MSENEGRLIFRSALGRMLKLEHIRVSLINPDFSELKLLQSFIEDHQGWEYEWLLELKAGEEIWCQFHDDRMAQLAFDTIGPFQKLQVSLSFLAT